MLTLRPLFLCLAALGCPLLRAAPVLPSWQEAWTTADRYDPGLHHTFPVLATHSMLPVLDWDSLVLLEQARFADLGIGDIVGYRTAAGALCIHRIIRRNGDGTFVVKGDALPFADRDSLTPKNCLGRASIIFYYDAQTLPKEKRMELWQSLLPPLVPTPKRTVRIMYLSHCTAVQLPE